MEAKVDRSDWEADLPEKMRAYFEGTADGKATGLRNTPFFHKRSLPGGPWECLKETDSDYNWFKDTKVEYLFCFAYTVGKVSADSEVSKEIPWLTEAANGVSDSCPSLFLCISWKEPIPDPRVAYAFSRTFPEAIAGRVKSALASYTVKSDLQ